MREDECHENYGLTDEELQSQGKRPNWHGKWQYSIPTPDPRRSRENSLVGPIRGIESNLSVYMFEVRCGNYRRRTKSKNSRRRIE